MENNFKDPLSPNPSRKNMKNPWNFMAPQYDERSSCYVDAGTHYGVGYNNPIGHAGNPKTRVDTLPYGRVETKKVDQAPRRILNPEMQE